MRSLGAITRLLLLPLYPSPPLLHRRLTACRNFNSFLVDKAGIVRSRYDTLVQPQTQVPDIMTLLAE